MRFTAPQGRTEEPPVPPRRSNRSSAPPPYTPRYSTYGFIILSEEEEKKLSRPLQGFGSNATLMICNVENLVAIDGCITTILSLITKKKIKIKNVMIWD
jgi:hypothetical protein